MLIHAISDLHGFLPTIPKGDVLLIAGDIVPMDCHSVRAGAAWLDTTFRKWLESLPVERVIATWGNHDFVAENRRKDWVPPDLPWSVLVDRSMRIYVEGTDEYLNVYGAPWQATRGWAFAMPEEELEEKWKLIPSGLDVLLTHGPSYMVLDRAMGTRFGSKSLLQAVDYKQPRVHIHGHIHESHGDVVIGTTHVYNVALVDEDYRPVNKITTFTLEGKKHAAAYERVGEDQGRDSERVEG